MKTGLKVLVSAMALAFSLTVWATHDYKETILNSWRAITTDSYFNYPLGTEFRHTQDDDELIPNLINKCKNSKSHWDDGLQHGDLVAQQNVPLRVAAEWPSWLERELYDFSWSWWFGDQRLVRLSRIDDSDIYHTYRELGTYKVFVMGWQVFGNNSQVKADDEWGIIDVAQQQNYWELSSQSCNYFNVKVVPNHAPTAHATAHEYYVDAGEVITFFGAGSSDPDGNKLTYRWNFSDGDVRHGKTVGKSFQNNNVKTAEHTAVLTVSDGDKSDSASITVRIRSRYASCGDMMCP